MSKVRTSIINQTIEPSFMKSRIMIQKNSADILKDPDRIFNADETGPVLPKHCKWVYY